MAENKIYEAISGVMADIGAVGKDSKNTQQNFMYRGIDAVMNALQPAMVRHKVFVIPEVLDRTVSELITAKGAKMNWVTCKIQYTFFTTDGSSVKAVTIGEGMDMGDKATNKAMSIAFKYACFQVFCIPTEEMIDPDSESPEMVEPDKSKKAGKRPEGKTQPKKEEAEKQPEKIDQAKINILQAEMKRTGVQQNTILSLVKKKSLEELTPEDFKLIMKKFEATPDKKEGQ